MVSDNFMKLINLVTDFTPVTSPGPKALLDAEKSICLELSDVILSKTAMSSAEFLDAVLPTIFAVLLYCESGNRFNEIPTRGKKGNKGAVGPLQILNIYAEDVQSKMNRFDFLSDIAFGPNSQAMLNTAPSQFQYPFGDYPPGSVMNRRMRMYGNRAMLGWCVYMHCYFPVQELGKFEDRYAKFAFALQMAIAIHSGGAPARKHPEDPLTWRTQTTGKDYRPILRKRLRQLGMSDTLADASEFQKAQVYRPITFGSVQIAETDQGCTDGKQAHPFLFADLPADDA